MVTQPAQTARSCYKPAFDVSVTPYEGSVTAGFKQGESMEWRGDCPKDWEWGINEDPFALGWLWLSKIILYFILDFQKPNQKKVHLLPHFVKKGLVVHLHLQKKWRLALWMGCALFPCLLSLHISSVWTVVRLRHWPLEILSSTKPCAEGQEGATQWLLGHLGAQCTPLHASCAHAYVNAPVCVRLPPRLTHAWGRGTQNGYQQEIRLKCVYFCLKFISSVCLPLLSTAALSLLVDAGDDYDVKSFSWACSCWQQGEGTNF